MDKDLVDQFLLLHLSGRLKRFFAGRKRTGIDPVPLLASRNARGRHEGRPALCADRLQVGSGLPDRFIGRHVDGVTAGVQGCT